MNYQSNSPGCAGNSVRIFDVSTELSPVIAKIQVLAREMNVGSRVSFTHIIITNSQNDHSSIANSKASQLSSNSATFFSSIACISLSFSISVREGFA